MNNVIGYREDPKVLKYLWNNMMESRRSYKMFANGPSEHEFNIANQDKRLYTYFLSKYLAA